MWHLFNSRNFFGEIHKKFRMKLHTRGGSCDLCNFILNILCIWPKKFREVTVWDSWLVTSTFLAKYTKYSEWNYIQGGGHRWHLWSKGHVNFFGANLPTLEIWKFWATTVDFVTFASHWKWKFFRGRLKTNSENQDRKSEVDTLTTRECQWPTSSRKSHVVLWLDMRLGNFSGEFLFLKHSSSKKKLSSLTFSQFGGDHDGLETQDLHWNP